MFKVQEVLWTQCTWNRHTQTAENALYYWLFLMWRPPALGKIWPWLLPDKGGVSCRYVGPWVRLMNGGFYHETTRELQERMSGWAMKREALAAHQRGQSFPNIFFFMVVNTQGVYVHAWTYMRAQRHKHTHTHTNQYQQVRQHLRVIQKLSKHRLCSSQNNSPDVPSTHIWETFPLHWQIIIHLWAGSSLSFECRVSVCAFAQ